MPDSTKTSRARRKSRAKSAEKVETLEINEEIEVSSGKGDDEMPRRDRSVFSKEETVDTPSWREVTIFNSNSTQYTLEPEMEDGEEQIYLTIPPNGRIFLEKTGKFKGVKTPDPGNTTLQFSYPTV